MHTQSASSRGRLAAFIALLGALGVVYGDVGTSVLYTVNEIFFGHVHLAPTPENVYGALSLVVCALVLIATLKYNLLALRADNDGEGGVFALFGLLERFGHSTGTLITVLVLAACLLAADGIITPAISVLSAVEGLAVATSAFEPYLILIAVVILTWLFASQRRGTERIGRLFGPIMLVWFIAIGVLGIWRVLQHPQVLHALNPYWAFRFVVANPIHATLLVLASVTLSVTGVEAMYADIGQVGKRPVRTGWARIVLWSLLACYLGQGAYLLGGGTVFKGNVFYSLVPRFPASFGIFAEAPLYLMVALATAATVIASQALITGAFTLSAQAMALGVLPRFKVVHTSRDAEGQIYVPTVNWLLYAGCLGLIFAFHRSTNLAAAYGLAVSGVFLATSIALARVARAIWHWPAWAAYGVFGVFALVDLALFVANSMKFVHGGYIPVIMAVGMFAVMATWRWGRILIAKAYAAYSEGRTMQWLVDLKRRADSAGGVLDEQPRRRLVVNDRAVVFLASRAADELTDPAPVGVRVYLKRTGTLPKHITILTVVQERRPVVPDAERLEVHAFGHGVIGVQAHYGFTELPNIPAVLVELKRRRLFGKDCHRCTIQVGEEDIVVRAGVTGWMGARIRFFRLLLKLSAPMYKYLSLTTEVGLSKTLVPILFEPEGFKIEIPEFPLEPGEEDIDPDTHLKTDIRPIPIAE